MNSPPLKAAQLPTTAMNLADLQEVLEMYNEVTQRLEQSHERLQAEVSRLTEQLEQKNKELEFKKRLAALGEMAAGIAHEIRNPLGGIQLYASTLAAEVAHQPLALELVHKISSGVRGLNSLVSDMLAFTQNIQVHKQPTSLIDLVGAAVELAAPTLSAHSIQVNIDGSIAGIAADLDPKLIRQVLLNLLLNAGDAINDAIEAGQKSNAGVIEIHATNMTQPSSQRAEGLTHNIPTGTSKNLTIIVIRDNGPGIPPEALDKLFNPFFTTKHKGTGLGLAIVHRIIESHGGTITAENPQEGGAQFTISLPNA